MELAQSFTPQRSNTQMLLPSGSMSTPFTCPILRPSGILSQPSSSRYGLGAPLGSAGVCANDADPSAVVIPKAKMTVLARNMDCLLPNGRVVLAAYRPYFSYHISRSIL